MAKSNIFLNRATHFFKNHMLETILIGLCIFLSFSARGFLSVANILNILRNSSMQGVIAFGMTMVIIAGEIDLSVGSAVAFSGCLTAWLTRFFTTHGFSPVIAVPIAIVGALSAGFLLGVLAASIRNRFNVPTFIITLAMMTALSGFANLITGGFPLVSFPDWYNFIGGGYIFGIPFPAVLLIIVFFVIHYLMTSTTFGRSIYAIGGNMEAARLSGIKVFQVKKIIMGITSSLMALGGIMVSSQILSGTPTAAKGWELDVISSVIIGGTAMSGGVGSVRGTFIGIIFLGVLVNGMTLLNISEYWQYVVRGGLILGAVLLNTIQLEKAANAEILEDSVQTVKEAV